MSKSLLLRGIVLFVCLLGVADTFAQQQDFARHNWYFGNTNRGIRFSRSTNLPSLVNNKAVPFSTGGSAVASNPINGDLMFYTDGNTIIDLTHVPMFGSFPLGAPASNQPVAVCKVPGAADQYYVFTNTASFTTPGVISVVTVDMSQPGNAQVGEPPIGAVVTGSVATGITNRSEGMIIVPDNTGTNFWLITHANGADVYTATLINGSGDFSSVAVTRSSAPNLTGFPMSVANFSYHAATGKLAVSPQTANRNVAILNFDNTTGAITFDRMVLTSGVNSTTNQAIYDTEWSPSGRFLYISVRGEGAIPANVVQFDMTAPAGTSLSSVFNGSITESYGLKLAPDSAIYHLYRVGASFLLGRFTDTDSVAARVIHTRDAFGGSINFQGRQFPEFLPPADNNLTVSFTSIGTCANSPVSFFPTVTPAADSLSWNFGDGTSSEWSPVHTFDGTGTLSISVTAYLNGQSATTIGSVTLTPFNMQLTLVRDTTACRCEFPPPVGQSCHNGPFSVTVRQQGASGTPTFEWSNNDIGATLTPDSAGYYYVIARDATGCKAYAGVNIREYDAVDQRANIWYFGERAGIDFNQQPPQRITGPIRSPEGVSVISDRNGEVVFSTDGVVVFDRDDAIINDPSIPGPAQIGGENGSTQSALIIPVPNDETLYYIFTTQQVQGSNTYELRYSLYDIKLRIPPSAPNELTNGDGGLVAHNQLLFTRSTERITSDGRWLIAHEYGNNSFRAYEISADGIGNPVISSVGSDHMVTEELNGQGYMKVNGDILAVALSNSPTSNFLEIFDFTDSTGVVSNFRSLNLNTTAGQVYGVEIVGSKILATIMGTSNSFLREAYIDFEGNPVLVPGSAASPQITGRLGAIQTGPDGTVYVAVEGRGFLSTINVNADTLQLSNFTPDSFPLVGGTTSHIGLPNFIQEIFTGTPGPAMNITALCFGSPTIFQGTGTDPIDTFFWEFGDGASADSANVEHTYPAPGDYTVKLRIRNRCGLDTTLIEQITIVGPPPNPTFVPAGQQPVVCNGPLTLQALPADNPDFSYLWSTGETTYTIQVDRAMIVSVTITNEEGCTSFGEIFVADNRPVIELGPDQTVCEDFSVSNLNAGNQNLVYQWQIDGVIQGNTTSIQPVNTSTPVTNPDPDVYIVTGRDANNCVASDTVTITIYPTPDVTLTKTDASACGVNDGQLLVSITGPSGSSFAYDVFLAPGTLISSGIDQSVPPIPRNINLTGLAAGTYTANVEDQISGCATTVSAGINNTTLTVTASVVTPACTAVPINVVSSLGNVNYRIINSVTGQVVTSGFSGSASFATSPVPVPGNYIVEVTTTGAPPLCTATFPLPITSGPQPVIDFVFDVCAQPLMTIGIATPVPGGATYDWSLSDATANVTLVNAPNTTADPADGMQTFRLTVDPTDPAQCPVTKSIDIFIARNITAILTQQPTNGCDDPVTISVTASPAGNYTYNWTRTPAGGGSPVSFIGGQSIIAALADNGATYTVVAVNATTGCQSDPVSIVAQVFGDIQIFLDPVEPCRGTVFSIESTPTIAGATYRWFLDGNEITGQTGQTLTGQTQEGTYSAIAMSINGCPSDEAEVEIHFADDPEGELPSKLYICNRPENRHCSDPEPNGCVLQLEAGDGISWQWLYGETRDEVPVPIAGATLQTLTVTKPGFYYVEIVNISECRTIDQTEVIERCQPEIILPNVFRPGGDQEINKTFSVYPFQTFVAEKGFQVFIYNRWGEMVYQSSNLHFTWNGTYKGTGSQLLPGGTYTYVIKYYGDLTNEGQQELRGSVLLLR